MLSPGDEFEWSVDGATLTLVMPAGAKHGQEHEFSFVADDGGTRFFKATIPSTKAVSINNVRVGGHAQGTALLQQAEGELIITCVHAETVWSEVTQTWIQAATEAKKHTLV